VNVNGSGCGLGHPIAATGARMVITMLGELRRRGTPLGCVSMCAGGGMGSAMVLERAAGPPAAATSQQAAVGPADHAGLAGAPRRTPDGRVWCVLNCGVTFLLFTLRSGAAIAFTLRSGAAIARSCWGSAVRTCQARRQRHPHRPLGSRMPAVPFLIS